WNFQTSSGQIKFVRQRRQMTSGGEARKSGLSQRFCQRVFPVVNTPTEGRAPPDYLTWNRHRNDRIAQIPLIHCRLRERIISDPLLPFPVGPGTGGERQDRPFLKEASNASARPGAQHLSQAIERREST